MVTQRKMVSEMMLLVRAGFGKEWFCWEDFDGLMTKKFGADWIEFRDKVLDYSEYNRTAFSMR